MGRLGWRCRDPEMKREHFLQLQHGLLKGGGFRPLGHDLQSRRHPLGERLPAVFSRSACQFFLHLEHEGLSLGDQKGRRCSRLGACGHPLELDTLKLAAPERPAIVKGAVGAAKRLAGLRKKQPLLDLQAAGHQGFDLIPGLEPDQIKKDAIAAKSTATAEGGSHLSGVEGGEVLHSWSSGTCPVINLHGARQVGSKGGGSAGNFCPVVMQFEIDNPGPGRTCERQLTLPFSAEQFEAAGTGRVIKITQSREADLAKVRF